MGEDADDSRKEDEVIALVAAVAAGDADRGDVVSALKGRGVDALDSLIDVLIEVARGSQQEPPEYLDPRQLANAKVRQRSPEEVHPAPSRAFIFDGVLYDPPDIERFNDRDLHFIYAQPDAPPFVTDDLALMTNWWQLLYLDSITGLQSQAFPYSHLESRGIIPHTNFWEYVGYGGDRLELSPGRAYPRLSQVSRGFLGSGDWNDVISSVQCVGSRSGLLWDHKHYQGSTAAFFGNQWLQEWDNRASACGAM